LMGVVMARYIVQIEPFASLPAEQIANIIGPNLQRYLTGDLPDGLAP
jgi:tetracycline repressor-like protein